MKCLLWLNSVPYLNSALIDSTYDRSLFCFRTLAKLWWKYVATQDLQKYIYNFNLLAGITFSGKTKADYTFLQQYTRTGSPWVYIYIIQIQVSARRLTRQACWANCKVNLYHSSHYSSIYQGMRFLLFIYSVFTDYILICILAMYTEPTCE